MTDILCRGCSALLDARDLVVDLGSAPPANALLSRNQLSQPETHYPLRALVCRECLLMQLPDTVDSQALFTDAYPFRSGLSVSWLAHCKAFADQAIGRFHLGATSRVLEIGSNDGAGMLRFRGRGIPVTGIEPCQEVAEEALHEGLATRIAFWTNEYAQALRQSGYRANLVIARNVLAHVPDLRDFLGGVRTILAPGGTAVFEVPFVGDLLYEGRWDQIYHEHHCYFNLASLRRALGRAGLRVFDVEHLPMHGGSMRVYAGMGDQAEASVENWLHIESGRGLHAPEAYLSLRSVPVVEKRLAWKTLADYPSHYRIAGYGASAKAANTLSYFGIGPDQMEYVADVTPTKWGKFLPGSHVPIRTPDALIERPPDVVVNFCWNWRTDSEHNIRKACPEAQILYLQATGVQT